MKEHFELPYSPNRKKDLTEKMYTISTAYLEQFVRSIARCISIVLR